MKREEKNALSRQRILDAAIHEFSQRGYAGASLNTVCAEKGISKGIIYHYFKDKDELYLACVRLSFEQLTQYMRNRKNCFEGSLEEKLQAYFDGRSHFFAENPVLLGIFADAVFHAPAHLARQVASCKEELDGFSLSVLTECLGSVSIRAGLTVSVIAEDFKNYMDYFNVRFAGGLDGHASAEAVLREHEERCHRQLNMLLYGVVGDQHENNG